ncbi:unnamed protein product [Paramecium sonneborni]|uniref:Uncharacterized protein n=1 Tax=Paramecium sonneborni TaxID=65129 RepID=A0A8S1QID9_9CILI|nr:unnamed protein product [Paramecium sonneborni]
MEERGQRSNEKVNGQLDYKTRKMVSPQTDVNIKKENQNPLDQNGSTYLLKGYERQVGYQSNQYDQYDKGGEQQKMLQNNNPYLKQSINNNNIEQGKPFIRAYQEGDQRKPLDQMNQKQEQRQLNEREIINPYMNHEDQKSNPIGSRTPIDPRQNMSAYTPQERQDNYHREVQCQDYKREFQQPEYRRIYQDQDQRIPTRQMSPFEMQQKPIDQQIDRLRYDQERIRTVGGQQEQPERMDRMIRAADQVRMSDNHYLQQQDKRVLERRDVGQRYLDEQQQVRDQRNNTSKSQEYSQRQLNQFRRPQEGSKTPIERRGYEDQIQQDPRYNPQSYPQNPYAESRTQQQYIQQHLDDQRRMPIPRNINPYETRQQQFQDQRLQFDRIPDRHDQFEFNRRPDQHDHPNRTDQYNQSNRLEFESRSPHQQVRFGPGQEGRFDLDQRQPQDGRYYYQGYNHDRIPPQGFRQEQEGKQLFEGRQAQRTQIEQRHFYGHDGQQNLRQGINYRDGRSMLDGRTDNREVLDERFGIMDPKQYQIDGRGGFNRTYGDDRYQANSNLDARYQFDRRREQIVTRTPIQNRPFEERTNLEQRIPIESRNQYQRAYNDKFGDQYYEEKYSQQQDPNSKKDFIKSDYTKMRDELDKRNVLGRPENQDKMIEFGRRQEFDGRIRPETNFGKPNGFTQQPQLEKYQKKELNDQGQRFSYNDDRSVLDRLGLERGGTNRNIIGNQVAENMMRGQMNNRPYDRERSFNRLGMGERVASFTNNKMGYQRTAVQDKEEYQGYVRSKLNTKPSYGNYPNEYQKKQSQDQGFQKLQSPQPQVETRVGIYDIQRKEGRI